ncbi:unnamed protein product [Paramecium sonneborni]|uniref:Uncharacterized protein n=1 Tax=Paramecium sonneborni TaxID=65129 RepID=A0A8S1LUG4_9CILI|nr:unnamed protein product [Paramecium sonneborni]
MTSNFSEPFIVLKNYRQQQQEAKKEQTKIKSQVKPKEPQPKEIQKKIKKQTKISQIQQQQQPIAQKIDPNLFSKLLQQHQQQQLMFQQLLQNPQINVQDDDLDQYSPVYLYGIPKTPQNISLPRGSIRDEDEFKI